MSVFKAGGASDSYFAPNACLQLAKLYLEERSDSKAIHYIETGLRYRHYEYQVSIRVQLKKLLEKIENEEIPE